MKKYISLILCLVLLLVCFSGCSSEEKPADTTGTEATTAPASLEDLIAGVFSVGYSKVDITPSEAVNLAGKRGFKNLKGFVNGVLRNVSRNKESIAYPDRKENPVPTLSVLYSMPEHLVKLLMEQYGEQQTEKRLHICRRSEKHNNLRRRTY